MRSDTADANRGFVCLLAELDNPDMGATCKKYVLSFEKLTRKDVNLRPLVVRTCAKDMNRLCSDAGLDVLSCLVDNVAKILNDDCKQLIDEEIELEVCGCRIRENCLDFGHRNPPNMDVASQAPQPFFCIAQHLLHWLRWRIFLLGS